MTTEVLVAVAGLLRCSSFRYFDRKQQQQQQLPLLAKKWRTWLPVAFRSDNDFYEWNTWYEPKKPTQTTTTMDDRPLFVQFHHHNHRCCCCCCCRKSSGRIPKDSSSSCDRSSAQIRICFRCHNRIMASPCIGPCRPVMHSKHSP